MPATVTTPRLTVRRPKLDYSETPRYWVLDDPQATHALNLLNFGIPAGERFFIDSVRLATKYITDPVLKAEAKSFIGQEVVHARLHERAAEHLDLFDLPGIRKTVERADRDRERLFKRVDALPEPFRKRATLLWLSTTLAAEHFTALLADGFFDEDAFDWSTVDPEMAALLRWHGAEELEHKAVPFDIYQHIGGDYLTRVVPTAIAAPVMLPLLYGITSYVMLVDRHIRRPASIRRYVQGVRAKRMVNLVKIAANFGPYMRPGHHPDHIVRHEAKAQAFLRDSYPVAS